MKMERIVIQLPMPLKQQLDGLKSQGYTASGFIRALLERELNHPQSKKGA
jgi:metal-responsive CopG/Arc/MetJ family transcriptional regulator